MSESKPMNERWEHLHNEAMALSDIADAFRRDKDAVSARDGYRRAMEKEREAALGYRAAPDAKPASIAILLRSAATLALDAGDWREAEKLVGLGLSGDAPPAIAGELRDLNERINFDRHLETRHITLSEEEIQLSLSGDGVSFGMVQSDDFLDRGEALQDLLYRAAERQSNQPYRRRGLIALALREQFAVFVSVPRGGSFAVTYRVGTQPDSLRDASPSLDPVAVMDEVTDTLRLFEEKKDGELRHRLGEAYYKNFVKQAKRIAPDGRRVTQVGLTPGGGGRTPVALRRVVPRQPRQHTVEEVSYVGSIVEYVGRIVEMKARDDKQGILVTLQTAPGKRVSVTAVTADEVKPFFEQKVRITVYKANRVFVVQSIEIALG